MTKDYGKMTIDEFFDDWDKNHPLDFEHMSLSELLSFQITELSEKEYDRFEKRWDELDRQGRIPADPKKRGFGGIVDDNYKARY